MSMVVTLASLLRVAEWRIRIDRSPVTITGALLPAITAALLLMLTLLPRLPRLPRLAAADKTLVQLCELCGCGFATRVKYVVD
jgi:hypothetical protein